MAEFLGRTENSVRLKASRLGLARPKVLDGTYSIAVEKIKEAYYGLAPGTESELLEDALDILDKGWRMEP